MVVSKKSFSCSVDSIHEGLAKLVVESGETFLISAKLLPKGSKEGSHIAVAFTLDNAAEQKAKKQVSELYKKLANA